MIRFKRKLGWANAKKSGVRINIPSEILDKLDAEPGDSLFFNVTDKNEVTITKAEESR